MIDRPYSADEQRVAKYIVALTGIGAGDDPIGFLIASHAALSENIRESVSGDNIRESVLPPTPSGFVVVPVMPTAEMVEAGTAAAMKPENVWPRGEGWTARRRALGRAGFVGDLGRR